jgi:hypothetical protein
MCTIILCVTAKDPHLISPRMSRAVHLLPLSPPGVVPTCDPVRLGPAPQFSEPGEEDG